ncbi:14322_t:CDS:1, partial [Acaulospora colombiana]
MKDTRIRRYHDPSSKAYSGRAKRVIWLKETDRRKPRNGPDLGTRKGRKGKTQQHVEKSSKRAVQDAAAEEI